jgi:hypothetical protein
MKVQNPNIMKPTAKSLKWLLLRAWNSTTKTKKLVEKNLESLAGIVL